MNDGGKGDKQRPTDHKKWSNNYDQIKWTVKDDKPKENEASQSLPERPTPNEDLAR